MQITETHILSSLINNEEYLRKVLPFLKNEYFKDPIFLLIFKNIGSYVERYGVAPTTQILAIELSSDATLTESVMKQAEGVINSFSAELFNLEWLLDFTETWVKDRAMYNALCDAIEISEGRSKTPKSAIPDLLTDALSVSFEDTVGLDYLESSADRHDFFNKVEENKIAFQLDIFNKITKNGFAPKSLNLILASSGTGKLQPVSEPVLTPNGWSTMGELKVGDYVIGSSGTPIEVLAIYPQGVKDVYTIKTKDGVDIRAGEEHLWSVWVSGHRGKVLKTYTTRELIDRNVLGNNGFPRYTLPKFDGLQGGKVVDFAYALGYCLGNDCFSRNQLTVSYDERIKDTILPLLESSLGTPRSTSNFAGHSGQSLYYWAAIHPEIAKYRDSGLSGDKHLLKEHQDWLLWDYNSRLELLRGLLDSDGCVGSGGKDGRQHNRFSSTSINLTILVRDLIRSLGGRACEPIAEKRTHYKSGNCWDVAFRMPVCPFKLKSDKWKPAQYSMQSTIVDIVKEDYQEESVCIRVDAEDCLYVTTGFKLTHNSIFMCDYAANVLSTGKNVLFITLEMSAEIVAQRIDANLLDTNINDLYSGEKQKFVDKISKLQQKTRGQLHIKEYPISSANTGHFKILLNELKIKKQFVPDVIVVDYLNICTSSRVAAGSPAYITTKSIAEELRALAVENNVPLVSAIQLNRSGVGNNDPDMANIADSYGIAVTADFIAALVSSPELQQLNQLLVVQIKNRYNSLDYYKKFLVGLDKPKMKFYDLEESTQNTVASATPTKSSDDDEDDVLNGFKLKKSTSKNVLSF